MLPLPGPLSVLTLTDLGPGCIISHSSSIRVLSGFLVDVNYLATWPETGHPEPGLGMAGDTGQIGGEVTSQPCFVGCGVLLL